MRGSGGKGTGGMVFRKEEMIVSNQSWSEEGWKGCYVAYLEMMCS